MSIESANVPHVSLISQLYIVISLMQTNETFVSRLISAFLRLASSSGRRRKMAISSPLNTKACYHIRSSSLPSEPHPLFTVVGEQLSRLRASESCSSPSSSICQKLSELQDLHDFVEKWLRLPLTQRTLVQESNERWVEELLEGSLKLLDLCTIAKEALLQTKESTNQLQSVLRRRRGDEKEIINEVKKCLASRMIIKKVISKALKEMENKHADKDHEILAAFSTLRDVKVASINTFETLVSSIAGSKLPSRLSGWHLISKLVHSKRVGCDGEELHRSEFHTLDSALHSITTQTTTGSDCGLRAEVLEKQIGKMESSVEDLEENLESLYRSLIKLEFLFLISSTTSPNM